MASVLRWCAKSTLRSFLFLNSQVNVNATQRCGYKKHVPAVLAEMKARRKRAGPEPLRHRSVLLEWNYDTEIYAFAKRLGEDWREETLRTAFVEQSYIENEEKRREELGISDKDTSFGLTANVELARMGEQECNAYVTSYLETTLPKVPTEGIDSVREFLTSDEVLSHVSKNIGTSDLILCSDFPPKNSTLANVLKALVGGLANDCGPERAHLFIQDFILTQLVDRDINELWEIPYPEQTLVSILHKQGRGPPEPRLLWEAGRNTLEASYCVGLYSDKKLVGVSVGETLETAQQMAARDALKRVYGLEDSRPNFPFGNKGRQLRLSVSPKLETAASKAA